MRKQLIVAKYNENMDWVKGVDMDTLIYNKGNDFDLESVRGNKVKIEEIKLSNIGKESHTLLYHIVNNYDNLADYIAFFQGKPFDHLVNFTEKYPNLELVDFLNNFPESEELFGFGHYHIDIGYIDQRWHMLEALNIDKYKFGEMYCQGCQWILPKNVILNRSLDFWKVLLSWHEDPNNGIIYDVDLPSMIERLWLYIFNGDFISQ
jgi:hypothetical protein